MATDSGRVVRLELSNFKSYRGTVTVGPFKDFTCIIGPNGSGKSNTMDAMSFVLGVRAAHLRGHNLKDLIYSVPGVQAEKSASVSLFFQASDDTEFVFKRTIRPDGSTEYRINNALKTWDEYDDVLRRFHILTKARNFLVFQGDVENVASKAPKDLTALLELVSGSDELRDEFEAKKKAKETAAEKVMAATAKKREMGVEKSIYKMQKKEAEKFTEIQQKQDALRRELALFQLYHIESALETMKRQRAAAEAEVRSLTEKNTETTRQLEEAQKKLSDLHKSSLQMNKTHKDKQAKHRTLTSLVDKLQVQIKHNEERLTDAKALLERSKASGAQNNKEVANLQQQLATVTADRDAYKHKAEESMRQIEGESLTPEQYEEWKQLKEKAMTQTITTTQEIAHLNRQKASEEQHAKTVSLKLEQFANRVAQLEDTTAKLRERKQQLEENIKKDTEGLERTKEELEKLKRENVEREREQATIDEQLSQMSHELTNLRFDKQESARDQKIYEAVEQMKQLYPGTKGKLTELCTIANKKYQAAVTVAMGKNMEAVVVDTDTTAINCIMYLKEQRLPPMTFIPLETIKAPEMSVDRVRHLGGSAQLVLSCIRFDPSIEVAVRYAVGNTIVCDSLDEAKRVAFGEAGDGVRHKVVAVDGTLILKNGTMQGGQATVERRARKWDEHKYEAKKADRDRLVEKRNALTDIAVLKSRELELSAKITQLNSSIQTKKNELTSTDRRVDTAGKELDVLKKQQREVEPQLLQVKERVKDFETKIKDLEEKKRTEEKKIFAPLEKKVKIADLERYDEKRTKVQSEMTTKLAEFNVLLARLEQQLSLANLRAGAKDMKNMERNIENLNQSLKKDTAELGTAQKDLDKLNTELQKLKAEMDANRAGTDENAGKVKEIRLQMGSKLDQLGAAKKQISTSDAAISKLRSARAAVLQRCSVERIDIPMKDAPKRPTAGPGAGAAGAKRRKGAAAAAAAAAEEEEEGEEPAPPESLEMSEVFTMADVEGSTTPSQPGAGAGAPRVSTGGDTQPKRIDFSELSEPLRRAAQHATEFRSRSTQYEEGIQQLAAELDKIAPNIKAAERYTGVQEKYEAISKEYDVCNEESKKAMNEFTAIAERRQQVFMDTFDKIVSEIDKVYKELTRDDMYPAGGAAYISLDNPEYGFSGGTKYTAMPPTKRYRDIEQLSGGEKTIAALALLFTIQRVHPSPFFILDEIDAALDAGNVNKVCNYVVNHCSETQFIVISLKPEFYEYAQGLLGVYKDRALNASRMLSWDMDATLEAAAAEQQQQQSKRRTSGRKSTGGAA